MFLEKYRLDGKIAIVVGASRGIGKAIAAGFAEAGADIVIASRTQADLQLVADEIARTGRRCLAVATHAAKKQDIDNLMRQAVEHFGKIDILVNDAATNPFWGEAIDAEEWVWDAIMNLNLKGTFLLGQAAAKVMIKNGGGCILNVASSSGLRPYPGLGIYSVSKAGVIMLTEVLAIELGKYNIRVNAIAPGTTKTRMSQGVIEDSRLQETILQHAALKRLAEPDDMVGAAIMLVSDASRHVTGQTVSIDGGLTTF